MHGPQNTFRQSMCPVSTSLMCLFECHIYRSNKHLLYDTQFTIHTFFNNSILMLFRWLRNMLGALLNDKLWTWWHLYSYTSVHLCHCPVPTVATQSLFSLPNRPKWLLMQLAPEIIVQFNLKIVQQLFSNQVLKCSA